MRRSVTFGIIINFYCQGKTISKMQNLPNMSFFYFTNPMNYYTYLPITPSFSDSSTPNTENSLSLSPSPSFLFPSHLDQSYYRSQNHKQSQRLVNDIQGSLDDGSAHQPEVVPVAERENTYLPSLHTLKVEELSGQQVKVQNVTSPDKDKIPQVKRCNPKARKLETDQEYNPDHDRTRANISKYQINENRNVIPNEINQIFSFVQKQNKSGHITTKLFLKYEHPREYTIRRFYLYQSLLKNRLGHYSNEKSLKIVTELYEPKCENWSEQEQRFYNKISRILIHHFLHEDSIFMVLTSRRMKREKKCDHLRARREIAQSVGNILKGF